MLSFMFAVLGSTLFWVLFIVVGFFAGCLTLRFMAPKTYRRITKEHRLRDEIDDPVPGFVILVAVFLFWPIFLIGAIICFLIRKIFWPLLCKSIAATASIIPDIEIKQHKDT